MTKKERKMARHNRRVKNRLSRRALLKAGVAAVAACTSLVPIRATALMVPVPIKANVPAVVAPTWERLLNHVGNKDPRLRAWVHDLVLRPKEPQRPLLLTGDDRRSKALFHDAMRLLLPGGVHRVWYPGAEKLAVNFHAWLAVMEEYDEQCIQLVRGWMAGAMWEEDHYLKWSMTQIEPLGCEPSNVIRFDVHRPTTLSFDLARLSRERDTFYRSLKAA